MLLLGLFPRVPDPFYVALRWVVSLAFLSVMMGDQVQAREKTATEKTMSIVFIVLFNPLLPLELNRDLWILVDLAAAGCLGYVLHKHELADKPSGHTS